jgi:cyclin B
MAQRKSINAKMRSILVDWLVEVHYKFRLDGAVLWLAVNVMDRYLELDEVVRQDLQCVGVTSLLIASKYEEIFPPQVRDCVFITDNAFTPKQILEREVAILQKLDYQLCVPTGFHFMKRFAFSLGFGALETSLASYFAERSLQEHDILAHAPDELAAAACYLARRTVLVILAAVARHRKACCGFASTFTTTGRFLPQSFKNRITVGECKYSKPEEVVYEGISPGSAVRNMDSFCGVVDHCEEMYDIIAKEVWLRTSDNGQWDSRVPDHFGWGAEASARTGHTSAQLLPLAARLLHYAQETVVTASQRTLEAAKKKFRQRKYCFASCLPFITMPEMPAYSPPSKVVGSSSAKKRRSTDNVAAATVTDAAAPTAAPGAPQRPYVDAPVTDETSKASASKKKIALSVPSANVDDAAQNVDVYRACVDKNSVI